MIDFARELNNEQLLVVHSGDGPCLVLAGAGSGKTRTITYRVAYLLANGVEPENILLVTFTNKASREMLSRVELLTGGNVKLPWAGTFHHVAYKILKQYASLLGYQNNFTILDSEDSRDLFKICVKGEGIDRTQKRFPSPRVISSIVSYARNAMTTVADVLDVQHPSWLEHADTLSRIAEEYRKRKLEANAMDFDDLLTNLYLLLLKSPRVREKFAGQFRYVLVDEYQDTNKIQAAIVDQFASVHKNILVVGDDAQSIYSFRAAEIQNILGFEDKYENAKVHRLETNYRSTPEILALANDVITRNVSQYEKELVSIVNSLTKPEVQAFADATEEAEFVAQRILELRDEGVPLSGMSVLFRAAFHSQALEMELAKRDIPYDYRGGVRFFERAHIKDVLAYLRIFANVNDSIAWSRVLNMQVGIGPVGSQKIIQKIQQEVQADELSELGSLLSSRGQVGWADFMSIYTDMQKAQHTPVNLINAVLNSRYTDYLENEYPDYRERIEDVRQLGVFAERAKDLNQFLAEASMQESYAGARARDTHSDDEDNLVLSTIHQAKGLEWDAVFVLNVSAGQFPHDRALRSENGLEEERRLFYVAVTRAKKFLHITYPVVGNHMNVLGGPSLFLEELDRSLVSYSSLTDETVFFDPSDDEDNITYVPFDDDAFSSKRKAGGFLIDV